MAQSLQQQLGRFLRVKRGDMTYPEFSRKMGLAGSSLHRMEMGTQNVTLKTLEQIMKRLNCTMADIFRDRVGK